MDISKISIGKNPPHEINVIIEIPAGFSPVKYEMDKDSGAIFVDRFMSTTMNYPCNYGFIPHTLSGDGDPADVLVVGENPIVVGGVVLVRPIGVLMMEDESGVDEKIIAVPVSKLTKYYDNIQNYTDLPEIFIKKIIHFFEHYKDLEANKWVKVTGYGDKAKAEQLISEAIERYNKQ